MAQDLTPEMLGFESYTLTDENLGSVSYYITKTDQSEPKPLFVYLDGSGAFPLFQKVNGGIGSTVVIDFQNLSKEYTILLISKPGVPFIDEVGSDPSGFPSYDEPEAYTNKLSNQWRVESASKIIDKLVAEQLVDNSKVVVLGFSEGAQVAPFVARKNQYVSHLMLFGGNGLNQFFDPLINIRMLASSGQISEKEAQNQIDSLFLQYKEIYKNPEATDKHWWGHTYKRWASFTSEDPYKALTTLNIPIYMANGSLDENSVLSADYIQLEFIKQGKSNLTYKTYPGLDHQFNELIIEDNQVKGATSKLDEIMSAAYGWLDTQ